MNILGQIPGMSEIERFLATKKLFGVLKNPEFCMAISTGLWAIKPFLIVKLCTGQFKSLR